MIESALGVELAFQLARSPSRIASITPGEADLRADLGVSDDAGLLWCRSRIVTVPVIGEISCRAWTTAADVRPPSPTPAWSLPVVVPDCRDDR